MHSPDHDPCAMNELLDDSDDSTLPRTSPNPQSSVAIQRHLEFSTEPDDFGLFRTYSRRPITVPDMPSLEVASMDLSQTSEEVRTSKREWFRPFENATVARLMKWLWN